VLYTRISKADNDYRFGVDKQLSALRTRAEQEGWEVVAEVDDNDKSAFKKGGRPGFDSLVSSLDPGR